MIHIARPQDCCGCTACFSACAHKAIELVSDAEGFLYPAVKMDLCTDCGVCEKVCPAMHRKSQTSHSKPKSIKAIRIKDAQLLERSSSGGVFIAASQYVKTSYRGGFVVQNILTKWKWCMALPKIWTMSMPLWGQDINRFVRHALIFLYKIKN